MAPKNKGLLSHLPEIFQNSDDLRTVLSVFDHVLFGPESKDSGILGLEQIIARIPGLFNPQPEQAVTEGFETAFSEFLPWLADWVSLEQAELLPEDSLRRVIAGIVPLYAVRGTKSYLQAVLALFFPQIQSAVCDDPLPGLKVGESRVGMDTRLGGDIPFQFYVKLQLPGTTGTTADSVDSRLMERIRSVIDSAKPAHTSYQLECVFENTERPPEAVSVPAGERNRKNPRP